MTRKSDSELGMGRDIARRDFLQGMAIGVTLGGLAPELARAAEQEAQNAPDYYPPTRLGMRGNHPGAFEAAHELRDGNFWNHASSLTDDGESYDLVIAGGGISGLSAAYFWRAAHPAAKILIIENHDDFGGHARRNEFHVGGRMELINGGTLEIDSPYPYSAVASGLLRSLGVEPAKLSRECDVESAYAGMGRAVFFDRETFGEDRLVWLDDRVWRKSNPKAWPAFLEKAPLALAVKKSVLKIQTGKEDYFAGLGAEEKKDRLSRISYKDYLLKVVKADPGIVPFYQHITDEWWGVGFDAISALDCWALGYPGFDGLKLKPGGPSLKRMGYTPAGYSTTGGSESFHFPDGNASIARLLVRALIPAAIPGKDAHDIVAARCDYGALDRPGDAVRIRLNNIVVRARNTESGVEVAYTASRGGGPVRRVRAKACVLAGFNAMIPWLAPELPAEQKKALHALVRCPLVYTSVALRNWRPFHSLRVRRIEAPGSYHMSTTLNPAVDIGAYRSPRNPDEPNLIRMVRAPAKPGLPEYDQNRFGRLELLQTPFETFERNIRDQLARMLGPGGFDPVRDIEGIAVNRWAHGYAPEYNSLWDTGYDAQHGPNLVARRPLGRIAIANSDAGFAAYTDSAIDQAHRAVTELMKV
jgi:spermidine dehydrogenase